LPSQGPAAHRFNHPTVKVLLDGTMMRVLQLAGELCGEGSEGPFDHRTVLDHIQRLLDAHEQGCAFK